MQRVHGVFLVHSPLNGVLLGIQFFCSLTGGIFLGFVVAENTLPAFMEDTLIFLGHMSIL